MDAEFFEKCSLHEQKIAKNYFDRVTRSIFHVGIFMFDFLIIKNLFNN